MIALGLLTLLMQEQERTLLTEIQQAWWSMHEAWGFLSEEVTLQLVIQFSFRILMIETVIVA